MIGFFKQIFTWWNRQTFGTFIYTLFTGKLIGVDEYGKKKYITSFLFKLKSKPAALYQSLGGFAINGVNLTKLQSYPEKKFVRFFLFFM